MPYACSDRELGNCSGRAYKRKGVEWRLCRRHWYELLMILNWAASGEPPKNPPAEIKDFMEGRVGI